MTQTIDTVDALVTLRDFECLNLATFRKTGVPVVTTVWFALDAGKLYIWTAENSGKVKRIRNNPLVSIAPSSHMGKVRGPAIAALARILPPSERETPERLMNSKYGWMKKLFELVWRLRGQAHIYLELVPTELTSLVEGGQSEPRVYHG
jgi:PPOX class probable F420-dependent enzyme